VYELIRACRPSGVAAIQRIHPYVRVYCAIALGIAAAIAWSPAKLCVVVVITLLVGVLSGMCTREILPLTLSLVALYFGLAAVSALAGMDTSEMRPTEFVVFAGRCVSAFLAFRALFVTTHHTDVARALAKLKIPLLFVTVAGSIFRWLTLILDQAKNANNARLLRGGGLRRKPEQIRDLKHMSASLMLRSVAKADRIASAMECRGFSGRLVSPVAEAIPIRAIMPLVVLVGLIAIVWVVTP